MPSIPLRIHPCKPIIWHGRSREDLQAFPKDARHRAGHELLRVQRGLDPDNWKPMPAIGPGVREIRVHKSGGAFRVIYLATRPEGIHVLHCFQKAGQKTSRQDIALAEARLKGIRTAEGSVREGN